MPVIRTKNHEHLKLLCYMINNPDIPVKFLNTLFALRLSWGSKGFFNARELQRLSQIAEKWPSIVPGEDKPELKSEPKTEPKAEPEIDVSKKVTKITKKVTNARKK